MFAGLLGLKQLIEDSAVFDHGGPELFGGASTWRAGCNAVARR